MNLPTPIECWNQLMCQRKLGSNAITVFDLEVNYDAFINFIQLTLELGQFVPTDKKGEPMEEPKQEDYIGTNSPEDVLDQTGYDHDMKVFQEALDRVIFPGWKFHDGNILYHCVEKGNLCICFGRLTKGVEVYKRLSDKDGFLIPINEIPRQNTTIESLIPLGIQVTDTKAEELKL